MMQSRRRSFVIPLTLGGRSFRSGQGAPDRPDSPLLDRGQGRAVLSHELHSSSRLLQRKPECKGGWFWDGHMGGRGSTTAFHPVSEGDPSLCPAAVRSPLACVPLS